MKAPVRRYPRTWHGIAISLGPLLLTVRCSGNVNNDAPRGKIWAEVEQIISIYDDELMQLALGGSIERLALDEVICALNDKANHGDLVEFWRNALRDEIAFEEEKAEKNRS